MPEQSRSDAYYALGHSEEEKRRLQQQGDIFRPFTMRFLQEAGIAEGMKVLDVGMGAGDVALLMAHLVGPKGYVVGIDVNGSVLETARQRASAAGYKNMSFVHDDIRSAELAQDFDAVVGRAVLMYMGEPVEVLRKAATHTCSSGIIAFHEMDFTASFEALPASPTIDKAWSWLMEVVHRTGMERNMGFKLRNTFLNAGLPEPRMGMDALLGGGTDFGGYEYLANTIRSFLPFMEAAGIATVEEVDIDTLANRMRSEVVGANGVVKTQTWVGAWARKG